MRLVVARVDVPIAWLVAVVVRDRGVVLAAASAAALGLGLIILLGAMRTGLVSSRMDGLRATGNGWVMMKIDHISAMRNEKVKKNKG